MGSTDLSQEMDCVDLLSTVMKLQIPQLTVSQGGQKFMKLIS
jgi:hypothetical protein